MSVATTAPIVRNEEPMEDPNPTVGKASEVDSTQGSSPASVQRPVDEKLQKLLDKALYGGGHLSAQKIRISVGSTWLRLEPLHVVCSPMCLGVLDRRNGV